MTVMHDEAISEYASAELPSKKLAGPVHGIALRYAKTRIRRLHKRMFPRKSFCSKVSGFSCIGLWRD